MLMYPLVRARAHVIVIRWSALYPLSVMRSVAQ